jgi:hypothetical protein
MVAKSAENVVLSVQVRDAQGAYDIKINGKIKGLYGLDPVNYWTRSSVSKIHQCYQNIVAGG